MGGDTNGNGRKAFCKKGNKLGLSEVTAILSVFATLSSQILAIFASCIDSRTMGILIASIITGAPRNLKRKRVRIAEDEVQRGSDVNNDLLATTEPSPPQRLRRRNARRWLRADMRPARSALSGNSYAFGLPAHDLDTHDDDDSNEVMVNDVPPTNGASNTLRAATSNPNDNSLLIRQWERRADDIRRRLGDDINFDFTNLSSNEPTVFSNMRHIDTNDQAGTIHPRRLESNESITQRLRYENRRRTLGQVRRVRERFASVSPPRAIRHRDSDSGHNLPNSLTSGAQRFANFQRTEAASQANQRSIRSFGPIRQYFPSHNSNDIFDDDSERDEQHDHGNEEPTNDNINNNDASRIGFQHGNLSTDDIVRLPLPIVQGTGRRPESSGSGANDPRRRAASPHTRNRNRHTTVMSIDDDDDDDYNVTWTLHNPT